MPSDGTQAERSGVRLTAWLVHSTRASARLRKSVPQLGGNPHGQAVASLRSLVPHSLPPLDPITSACGPSWARLMPVRFTPRDGLAQSATCPAKAGRRIHNQEGQDGTGHVKFQRRQGLLSSRSRAADRQVTRCTCWVMGCAKRSRQTPAMPSTSMARNPRPRRSRACRSSFSELVAVPARRRDPDQPGALRSGVPEGPPSDLVGRLEGLINGPPGRCHHHPRLLAADPGDRPLRPPRRPAAPCSRPARPAVPGQRRALRGAAPARWRQPGQPRPPTFLIAAL